MRRQRKWLVAAAVLFALGALLMLWGQGDRDAPPPPQVEFPRALRDAEQERAVARRTQRVPVATPEPGTPPEPAAPRDPVLAALPRGKGHTAVVFEANALRHSPVGELLLACLMRDGGKQLREVRERTGVDPLEDLDRLVVTDEGVILSGNFAKARTSELFARATARSYGDSARLYEPPAPEGGEEPRVGPDAPAPRGSLASWNDQLFVVSKTPQGAQQVIDRVEGRAGDGEQPLLGEDSTYGEMYGVVSVDQLSQMLGNDQPELLQRLREVADHVELHIDARSDVAVVAEVKGADAAKVEDLGKSLGAALSVARLKAQAEGSQELSQLLDFARVRPEGDTFQLEVALPLDYLKQKLAFCSAPPDAGAP
ncbi:hypothetical protein FGE12_16980 [Aggregicoccus sp. 17bor-14]|uniref:hypothetical protein n=1 Tax=Myxococcaceae TaxID=31 RepID=UPI00129CE646|nr:MULTISPECIES: hypothetical protein [Myxococcaceae]MBF5044095.1 hypothetical protein [Simulacricoccus sp. 17bor-14]MRI89846.1 hypothetical protein [Aggregicoccus sp. 17bor-14]